MVCQWEELVNRERRRPAAVLPFDIENGASISRRTCLVGAATLVGVGTALGSSVAGTSKSIGSNSNSIGSKSNSVLIASRDNAVVATAGGQVRGYTRNGIYTFKGIPYAESTAAANRFMPPVKLKPWSGVRSCMAYGPVSPQPPRPRLDWQNDEANFLIPQNDGIQDEDCLRVNVWTLVLGANAKLPVMVWLHGGRYSTGSGQNLCAYDGENLSRRGEVIVVSLNHRLGALGFMDLSQWDERYATSGNVGMLDIVAALEWVRDNIASFGGDPARVTIFGHSGGAGKVAALMAMPGARGLFHRAIAQSGPILRVREPQGAQRLAEETLSELGLDRARLMELQYMPYNHIVAAGSKVISRYHGPIFSPDLSRLEDTVGWAPVNDGKSLLHPFDSEGLRISAHVPMLVGTTLNEVATNIGHPDGETMTDAQLLAQVHEMVGERAAEVVAVFRERTPRAKPFDLWSRIASAPVRGVAIEQCKRKAALAGAPAWLYWFTWQTPVLDGRPHAFHGAELPFMFNNAEHCESITGGGPDAIELAHRMSDTWAQFARAGDPNHAGLQRWPAFNPERMPTMIFDSRCQAQEAPDGKEQAAMPPSR
jgi:para-nitrobenzyl esterase